MKSPTDNPPKNALGAGISEVDLREAVARSGYPLQSVVARVLRQRFFVQEEWSFVDPDEGTIRAIDMLAEVELYKHSEPQPRVRPTLDLITECKASELPYVFFLSDETPRTPRFPLIARLRSDSLTITSDDDPSTWHIPVLDALGLSGHPFLSSDPRFARTFSRAERKGSKIRLSGNEPYNSLVLPLVKAAEHFLRIEAPPATAAYFDFHLTIPLAMLDAPMIGASPTQHDRLEMVPWVRVPRHQGIEGRGFDHRGNVFAIDVVHVEHLETYLVQHLLPFAQAWAELVLKHQVLLAHGRGFARNMGADPWDAIEPRLEPTTMGSRASRGRGVASRLAAFLTGPMRRGA